MKDKSVCEEQVFIHIHQEQSVPLRNFLYYRFGSLEKAQDCAQESFVRLWENCSKVAFEKAKSYLFTIANRIFLDDVSHQKVVLKFEKHESMSSIQMEHNPEYVYRESEFKSQLETAVSSLPDKQRTVFLMSRIDKIPNKEIAETLDISIKTVEKHMTSALKSLKEQLDELKDFKI
ncbi:RNA polymerase sigma factor [Reichenbachiella agariperforans]|uniref:RNA polymerase sigma-70 factor, ECF subfamily n=1 Tax=Reichenbachiella agariperforans TaxID=156994 RepID=A0A1M6P8U1_REIAG|nr:sigma-70 family RNA polymerase sigma factor [Reichenbachiella agariperforans]MBU2915373.1 sigma-70 family RNA polymerase sigma factor [Reichenbachiella agariperforans]SHK04358.1 RNA polymerase sigma-70 factor, ECF subfamily [Reichenbachiella agariperforans]